MNANNLPRRVLAILLAVSNVASAGPTVHLPVTAAPAGAGVSGVAAVGARPVTLAQPSLSVASGLSAPSVTPSLALPRAQSVLAQPALALPSAVNGVRAEASVAPTALPTGAAPSAVPMSVPGAQVAGRAAAAPSYAAAAAKSPAAAAAAALFARPAGPVNGIDDFFDGSEGERGDGLSASAAAPEAGAAAFAPTEHTDTLDLWVGRTTQGKLFDSKVSASIRMINNERSEWFWGKYQRELPVRVVAGNRMLFVTRILDAETKPVSELTLRDLKAYFGSSVAKSKAGEDEAGLVARLKVRLLAELRAKAARNPGAPKVIGEDTKVRVLHFMPYNQAQHLPENETEAVSEIRPRKPVSVPEVLKPLSRMLPRLVLIDLKLLGDRVPWDLLEDMGKLQKAGMSFVLLSDKSQEEVDKMIERGMTLRQRDDLTRWKMFSLSNDGNTLYGYSGSFPKLKTARGFQRHEIDIIRHAAAAAAPEGVVVEDKSFGVTVRPKRGVSVSELEAALSRQIQRFGLPGDSFALTRTEVDGKPAVRVRPTTLDRAVPQLLADLQENEGLYLNDQHVMTVSENPAVKGALAGSLHAADHMAGVAREDYVETALAAMLGSYRENRVGDLAASASSIKSFKAKRFEYGGGSGNRIPMLLGHVAHTAFDWAVMKYVETKELPAFEELWQKALTIWDREHLAETVNLLGSPRERTLGYRDAMQARMRTMYDEFARTVKLYPIVLGSELPNLLVVDRYDAQGRPAHRDIFRGLYDVVLARRVADGLEVLVGDFKTGQTPALQHMAKDVQVLLYDFFSRSMWDTIAVPYTVSADIEKVVNRIIGFIYPRGMQGVSIGEFERLPFELFLANIMQRTRKHKGVLTEEMIEKELAAAKREAAKAAKAGKKAGAAAGKAEPAPAEAKVETSRPKSGDFSTLELPRTVPGLKIKRKWAQEILSGKKKIEYRTMSTNPKPFVAIIQTFTDDQPGRPAEVVAFARIERVTRGDGQYEWHISHVTPVTPYVVPNNKPGAIIWVKDVPVHGPERLNGPTGAEKA
ncbi:MAG: hypothetical protein HYZ75_05555 [Elusimicrobia bacterium]|nr:hypothetical protein [Elusimicrobiota bacterium]